MSGGSIPSGAATVRWRSPKSILKGDKMARTLYDDLFDDLAEMTYDGFIRGHEKQSEITQLMHENEVLRVEREKSKGAGNQACEGESLCRMKNGDGSKSNLCRVNSSKAF